MVRWSLRALKTPVKRDDPTAIHLNIEALAIQRTTAPAARSASDAAHHLTIFERPKKSDWSETITRVEPPRLLSYTFSHGGPESEVTFDLET